MDWIKNLKISHKLFVMIAFSLFFVIVVGIVGFVYTSNANKDIAELYNKGLIPIRDLSKMSINSSSCNADVLAIILSDTMQKKINYNKDIKLRAVENGQLLKSYEALPLTKEELAILPDIKKYRDEYAQSRSNVINLAFAGKSQEALVLYRNETKAIFNNYAKNLNALIDINIKIAKKTDADSKVNAKISNTILIITLLASFGLMSFLGMMIAKMITAPISQAV